MKIKRRTKDKTMSVSKKRPVEYEEMESLGVVIHFTCLPSFSTSLVV